MTRSIIPLSTLLMLVACVSSLSAQGLALRGVGAVNNSMAGASVAAPIDAAGAIHWNPASIAEFRHNEATFGLGLVLPDTQVASSVPTPFGVLSGSSSSESGVSPIPTMAIVHTTRNPRINFGLGAYAIAGFRVNYNASTSNPILLPQGSLAPLPTFGRVNTEAEFFQIAPTVSIALTERLSIGIAPTLTIGRLEINPLFAAAPVNGQYPTSAGSRFAFGGGAQFGVYYAPNAHWRFGASYKSEQWIEDFRFQFQDASGAPSVTTADFEYPSIVSIGTSYTGIPGVVWALDARYFDYEHARGFGTGGFSPRGELLGTGWRSVYSFATGVQTQLNHRVKLRFGHVYNTNPIASDNLLINSVAPLITEHISSVGASVGLTKNLTANLAYLHAWENQISGPFIPQVPGSTITLNTRADLLTGSLTLKW